MLNFNYLLCFTKKLEIKLKFSIFIFIQIVVTFNLFFTTVTVNTQSYQTSISETNNLTQSSIQNCSQNNEKIKIEAKRFNEVSDLYIQNFNAFSIKSADLITILNEDGNKTTDLANVLSLFNKEKDVFISTANQHFKSLDDLSSKACNIPETEFSRRLEEVKQEREKIINSSTQLETISKDKIKPELNKFRDKYKLN